MSEAGNSGRLRGAGTALHGAQGGCRIYSGPFGLMAGVSGEKGGIPIKLW
jgi:hypothetical protein